MLGRCVAGSYASSVDFPDLQCSKISISLPVDSRKFCENSILSVHIVNSKMFCYVTPEAPGKSKSLQLLALDQKTHRKAVVAV